MNKQIFSVAVFLLILCSSALTDASPPNILFILTDDQGWPSLSCYGNEKVETPHLDRLADEGVKFTQAYVLPQCTPTRAALLTGQQTARNGMWHVIGRWYGYPWAAVHEPEFVQNLSRQQMTIAKSLQATGYKTACIGKWHLTQNEDGHYVHLKQKAASHYGFDFSPDPPSPRYHQEGDKGVNWLTDQTIEFIKRNQDRRWFAYLSHHTIHGPVVAPQEIVKKYLDRGAPESGFYNATYLAAIEHLDQSIGRLLTALDEMKLSKQTLIVFLSDNGGVFTNYELPQNATGSAAGLQTLPVKDRQFPNRPLRAGKGSQYEGGIRVPCLVRWPEVIDAGQVVESPIHVTDWYPTLCGVANAKLPEDHVLDGVNLLPLMQGQKMEQRDLYWYLPLYDLRWAATPCAIIRRGDWKLIEYFGDSFDKNGTHQLGHRLELFHLGEDPGEQHNLVEDQQARALQMQQSLHRWIVSMGAVLPQANTHYDTQRTLFETREKQPWNE